MIKLYYTEDEKLLYSRNWPEVPPVQASIYRDEAMYREFKNQMAFLLRYPIEVTNDDAVKAEIVWADNPIEPGRFYEVEGQVRITSQNSCEVILKNENRCGVSRNPSQA